MSAKKFALSVILLSATLLSCQRGPGNPGDFEEADDVGDVAKKGYVEFDAEAKLYRVSGGGANIWGNRDGFFFVWQRMTGDVALQTAVTFPTEGGNPHRKAGLMIRENLEPYARYVDVVRHGDGLISMQFRRVPGGVTDEIQAVTKGPVSLRLERHANLFSVSLLDQEKGLIPVGALEFDFPEEAYVGLAVCAHDPDRVETAVFSSPSVSPIPAETGVERVVESSLETIDLETGERSLVYRVKRHFEAPNWSPDGEYLVFNMEGELYRFPTAGGEPERIDTGEARRCNNDHGFSPDGKWLAISHSPQDKSLIYVLPAGGGAPRLVTTKGPSYWHGWSPDGKTLAYCAERDGEYDVYTIPVVGGKEQRLTDAPGLDDGPDYSPDGRYIYFNSVRTGSMKIWRMESDGKNQTQVTTDEHYADWFPHPSPDGKWVVFLSYEAGVEGHPPNKNVTLRIAPAAGGSPRVLASLFGGQGTLNVPSWSPDSRTFAFVSYRLVAP